MAEWPHNEAALCTRREVSARSPGPAIRKSDDAMCGYLIQMLRVHFVRAKSGARPRTDKPGPDLRIIRRTRWMRGRDHGDIVGVFCLWGMRSRDGAGAKCSRAAIARRTCGTSLR